MANLEKWEYLLNSAGRWISRSGLACPSCGRAQAQVIARKAVVTQLRRCNDCRLLFRTPTGDAADMANFYQAAYSEGFTTTLPSEAKLKALLETSFVGTEKDISHYLAVLDALGIKTGARVLDFGCSWGYGTWQLAKAGFSAEAVEISAPRCDFARKRLGIDAHTSLAETHGQFDCVFSSHVLEHVSDPRSTVLQLLNKVGTGGVLVVFTPNGSLQFRDEKPKSWRSCWGLVHPTMMDDQFYERTFRSRPYYLASSPYKLDAIESWRAAGGQTVGNLIGDELLCVVAGEK